MRLTIILGAALSLVSGARSATAQLPAPAPPAPTLATVVPATLSLIAPDALAGLDFGLAASYRGTCVNLAPRGWVHGPGFYGSAWGAATFMHPPVSRTLVFRPRQPAGPPPSAAHAASARPSTATPVPVQIHGGFFAREQNGPRSYVVGLRGGPAIDEHLQIGLGVDWFHRSENEREVVAETVQVSRPIQTTRVLSQASSDQIPILAFLQVSVGKGLVPYAGIAGQYQFLLLSATDFATGADYNATFGGWGWQAWGGLGIGFGRSRLFGEVFVNSGDVERDVSDPGSSITTRETINAEGGGARFGLSWGF